MQHNIYTLEKEMLREIEQRSRALARIPEETTETTTRALGHWEVLVVTRTLVRIGPLVLAWDRR
jgi:hypothetical protein